MSASKTKMATVTSRRICTDHRRMILKDGFIGTSSLKSRAKNYKLPGSTWQLHGALETSPREERQVEDD
jgi:hypothetical protein